jgi:hypothetical protein
MTEESKEIGIQETEEILDFACALVEDLANHKADDGKIDGGEWLQAALGNAPAAATAIIGAQNVKAELGDADEAESKKLAEKGVALSLAVMKLLK